MSSSQALVIVSLLIVMLTALAAFLIYAARRYAPIIGRIFEYRPMFLPLRVAAAADGEDVRLTTADGLELTGAYYQERTGSRLGVVVYCHEFLSDRHSFQPYVDHLRDRGFDVFTFDFRNHGTSASDALYRPLQWVTDHEASDLRAAIDYVQSRPDHDPAGVGLFGVSRGGGTSLVVAADDPRVWGVVTDGAFPTRGTMLVYILRWAEIYVSSPILWKWMPIWVFRFLGWVGRVRSERRLHCRFPDVERATARLAPRPWFMIHGADDAYIGPEIARALFEMAGQPKDSWIVAGAKHNRCREVEPQAYGDRIAEFFLRVAPRREAGPRLRVEEAPACEARTEPAAPPAVLIPGELAAPVSR